MNFGVYLPSHGPFADAATLASLARVAEDAGWDGVFVWDELLGVFPDWRETADAMVALTAIAAATERVRLGALVSPLARLRPEVFAHQTATLDHFSGGRLIVGAGLGNPSEQFSKFGHPAEPKVRAAMLDEFLELLVQLWSGERVDFAGAHYSASGVALSPGSRQRPRIPIWIGADSRNRAPLRRAARWDGFAPASHHWPDEVIPASELSEALAVIAEHRAGNGPFDAVVIGNRDGTEPSPAALAEYAAAGVTWCLHQWFTPEAARAALAAGPPRL